MNSTKINENLIKDAIDIVEDQLDSELDKLNDASHIEMLRKKRLEQMKTEAKQYQKWIDNGHGVYKEIEERDFFTVSKSSDNVVIHFYDDSVELCNIFDHHLTILAKRHMETRFCKIKVQRSSFLEDRLKVKTIPTVFLIKENRVIGKLVGLSKLENRIDFNTELLEWRIAQSGIIKYDGDLTTKPDVERQQKVSRINKKSTIRGKDSDENDSGDDFL